MTRPTEEQLAEIRKVQAQTRNRCVGVLLDEIHALTKACSESLWRALQYRQERDEARELLLQVRTAAQVDQEEAQKNADAALVRWNTEGGAT